MFATVICNFFELLYAAFVYCEPVSKKHAKSALFEALLAHLGSNIGVWLTKFENPPPCYSAALRVAGHSDVIHDAVLSTSVGCVINPFMQTWRYLASKAWLAVCHPTIRMSRCSFHPSSHGWLVNLFLPVNRAAATYTQADIVMFHTQLEAVAVRLSWMLGPYDAIQFISGEDVSPRQFYKQQLTRDSEGIKLSERHIIHES